MARKDDHNILIENLATGQEEGFMLMAGDKPFTIQGMDNVATRIVEGETLYSDFTNSRVFAQSVWDEGLSKYWNPFLIYSTVFPTRKYRDSRNILISPGEFTIGSEALLAENFPDPTTNFSCQCNGEAAGVVYAGTKGILKIYKSVDAGLTWSMHRDLSSDTRFTGYDEISDIKWFKTKFDYGLGLAEVGKNIEELWFVAYDNINSKSITCCTKKGGVSKVFNTIGRFNATTIYDVSSGYNKSNNASQTFSLNTTVDVTTVSCSIIWQTSINGLTTAQISGAPISWQIGSNIEVFYGGVWENHMVKSHDGGSAYIEYSSSKTNGTYNCRLSTSSQYISLANSSDALFYGGGYMNSALYGKTFLYNGKSYQIYGTLVNNGSTSQASFLTHNSGRIIGPLYTTQNLLLLKCLDGDISGLINQGTISINAEDYVYINSAEATSYRGKKLIMSQGLNVETVLLMSENVDSVCNVGHYGATQYESNIYGYTLDPTSSSATLPYGTKHTLETGYYARCATNDQNDTIYIGTQIGTGDTGSSAALFSMDFSNVPGASPIILKLTTIGVQSISAIVLETNQLWLGCDLDGWLYMYDIATSFINKTIKIPVIDDFGKNYIDSMTMYNGQLCIGLQQGPGVLTVDPTSFNSNVDPVVQSDVLCSLPHARSQTYRITSLLNTGTNLLIGTNDSAGELYYYNKGSVASEGYLDSSIYGGYIPNVDKLWLYGYVRVTPWLVDDGQKVAVSLSFDEGQTWVVAPNKKEMPFLDTLDWDNADYTFGYNLTPDTLNNNEMFVFFFPFQTVKNQIQYRIHLKKGATYRPVVNHVAIHFNINVRQEMFINYAILLQKRQERLDGRGVDIDVQNRKFDFLRNTWKNQEMCRITHVDGTVYHVVPFSDDKTSGQGLVLSILNSNSERFDKDNLDFIVQMSFKTIANYDFLL